MRCRCHPHLLLIQCYLHIEMFLHVLHSYISRLCTIKITEGLELTPRPSVIFIGLQIMGPVNRITVTELIQAPFLVRGASGALLSILEEEPC